MNNRTSDVMSLELLPISQSDTSRDYAQDEAVNEHRGSDQAFAVSSEPIVKQHTTGMHQNLWLPFADMSEAIAFSLLIVAVIPIILLAAFAPRLASRLSSSSCLPNGEFVIPGTASIWNPKYIFTISIGFGSHSYTYVKVIDAIWDVVVGRGGQLILIWLAYRTFHKSLMYIMQTQTVPYSVYGAIAFNPGSLQSITQFIYISTSTEAKRSWRVTRIYVTIALCTVYIAAMPTLFSAMTGYASISAPSIEIVNGIYRAGASPEYCADLGNCTILPCGSSMEPVWAIGWDAARYGRPEPYWVPESALEGDHKDPIYTYYLQHKDDYLAAAAIPACRQYYNNSTLNGCPPLQKSSQITGSSDYGTITLAPPLLNIDVLGKNAQGAPKAFLCGEYLYSMPLWTKNINEGGADGVSALCTAGSHYQWGFSFLLLLIVSILNLVFAATMYGLWVDVRRNGNLKTVEKVAPPMRAGKETAPVNAPSHLRSALEISKQAELQYGEDVYDWPSWKLDSAVWHGRKGIRLQGIA